MNADQTSPSLIVDTGGVGDGTRPGPENQHRVTALDATPYRLAGAQAGDIIYVESRGFRARMRVTAVTGDGYTAELAPISPDWPVWLGSMLAAHPMGIAPAPFALWAALAPSFAASLWDGLPTVDDAIDWADWMGGDQ